MTTQVPQNMIVGGPAFSAWQSISQTIGAINTWTLLQYQTKEFDTNTCFNNTASPVTLNGLSVPAYAFMPNVPGYYQISGGYNIQTALSFEMISAIYKNGSSWKFLSDMIPSNTRSAVGSATIYLNGTTDYAQLYCYSGNVSTGINSQAPNSYFQAVMVRAA